MLDNHYELENEIIEEENDYETGDHGNHRPFTSDQSLTGKRPKIKTNNFYGLQSSERLPIMFPPQTRPFSDKSGKPSGRPKGQNTSFKSNDKSSNMIAKDLEVDLSVRNFPSPKKYLAMVPSSSQKNYKIIPRNIPQDKERLYDENLNLKNIVHHLREENLKLKTKVNVFEKESIRVEKMMAEQESNVIERDFAPKASENHLVIGLKNRLIEVENSLHEKETELRRLKKSVKVTKITELEVQLKTFTEESYRLKGILEQLIKEKTQGKNDGKNKQLQEENLIQAAQIKALEKDHEQLVKIVKAFEQQSADYEKKLNECEKKKKSETQKLKKLVVEKEKENLRLQQELENVSSNIPVARTSFSGKRPTIATKEDLITHEFERKKAENSSLIEQLTEKNVQIQHLEKMLKDATKTSVPNIMDKPTTLQHIEKPGFRKPSERLNKPLTLNVTNNSNHETNAQPTAEVKAHTVHEEELRKEKSVSYIEADKTIESGREDLTLGENEEESGRMPSVPRKRVQKLKAEDVKELGYEINLSLRSKGVAFDELNKIVWPQAAIQSGRLSIKEAIQILRTEPFNMKNEDDAILIARYLIEDNHEEYLYYDEETEGDLVIIKSILRKLIGSIPNWNKDVAQKLHNSVSEICTKYHLSLRENLRVTCKDGNLNKRALQEVCKLVEVTMSDEQMEYIITKLFEKSHDIQNLAIEGLFEIFYRPPKPEEIIEKPKEETKLPVQQTHQTMISKNSTPLSLSETKPKNEFTLPEKKPELKINESSLKASVASQEINSQTDVKSNKSSGPKVKESPKDEKILSEFAKSEKEEKSSRRDESRDYKDHQSEKRKEEVEEKEDSYENIKSEQADQDEEEEYAETPKQSNQEKKEVEEMEAVSDKEEEEENNEEEYKFEEDEEDREEEETKKSTHSKHSKEEVEQPRVAENNRLSSQVPNREHERTSSIEVSDSRRRLESQATNNTNTTQISDPRSEVFGLPSRNNQEERKGEDLNPISERDENAELKKEMPEEKKETKEEEYESENEYKEDAEEEVDEKEEIEEEDEKEKAPSQNKVAQKVNKVESEDEEYNDEEMGFEEEIEDDT